MMISFSLTLFIISSLTHLYASFKRDSLWRNISKPFLLLSLLFYYCFRSGELRIVVICAILFSFLGDVLLIKKGNKWFIMGGISFLISHCFYIISYLKDIDFHKINILAMSIIVIVYVVVVSYVLSDLKSELPERLFNQMYMYLMINALMNCFAIMRYFSNSDTKSLMSAVGALLFFVSDVILYYVRYDRNCKLKSHFSNMLTYIIGEFMIISGLIK